MQFKIWIIHEPRHLAICLNDHLWLAFAPWCCSIVPDPIRFRFRFPASQPGVYVFIFLWHCMWQLNGFRYSLYESKSKTADVKLSIRINSSVCVHFILAAAHLISPLNRTATPSPIFAIHGVFILDLEITTNVCVFIRMCVYGVFNLLNKHTRTLALAMSITLRRSESIYLPTFWLMTHFDVANALKASCPFIVKLDSNPCN